MTSWDFSEGILSIVDGKGNRSYPTAREIYDASLGKHTSPGLSDISSLSGPLHFSKFLVSPELVLSVEEGGKLTAVVTGRREGKTAPIPRVEGDFLGYVVMDQTWYPLAPALVDDIVSVFDECDAKFDQPLTLSQYFYLTRSPLIRELLTDDTGDRKSAQNLAVNMSAARTDLFEGELYPYQETGRCWLQMITDEGLGGILADEMGLGKTIQVIAVMAFEAAQGRISLVICPTTLLENWRREFEKFAPKIRVLVHRGPERTGFPGELKKCDVVVTSYDTLVRDQSIFRQIEWDIVAVDEAQAIKNPETQRAISIKGIPRRVGVAITGTPVENSLRDLWSITDFAIPDFLGGLEEFEAKFSDSIDGAQAVEPLISPVMIRRRVSEVAKDLPPKIEIPQVLSMSDRLASSYEGLRTEIIEEYGDSANLVALTKLRMLCAHPFLVFEERGDVADASPKFQRLLEILEEVFAAGEKALVFTSFTKMADLIVREVDSRYGKYARIIDGRTPVDERQTIIDEFGEVKGGAILALNPRAAGTGLNITAANHVIHYNLEWNPAIEDQASARSHRRGQSRPVTIHRLFFADTVEDAINCRLEQKRELAGNAVVGTVGGSDGSAEILQALRYSPVK